MDYSIMTQATSGTAGIYIVVFVAYIVLVLGFTFISKRLSDPDGFWTENRSVSGLRAGISLSATFMSISWSVVYGIEVFLQYGLGGFFVLSLPWIVVLGIFFWLAPRIRNIPVFSQPELISGKFGKKAGKLAALPILLVFIIWAGAEMDVAASLLAGTMGMSQPLLLFIIATVIAIYMSFSGTNAVIVTDVIQYILVALFFVIILQAGFSSRPVNPAVLKLDFHRIQPLFIVLTFIAYLPGWLAETDIWIRLQITRNGREARKAMGISLLNAILFVFIMPFLVAAFLPAGMTSGTKGVAWLLAQVHHPVFVALAAIGLIAASMSTIDTCVNVAAMTLSYDLTEKRTLNRNIAAIWITAALAFLFGVYSNSLKDAFYLSSGILSTTLFLPVLACYLPVGKKTGVIAVLALAPILTIASYALEKYGWFAIPGANGISYILISFCAALLLFFGGSAFNSKEDMII
ncbi:MAG: hypothetical protein GXO70_06315 [Acidobacteria bacterium]|nr:hypothetical protein [Acidobacteriota bacterium]